MRVLWRACIARSRLLCRAPLSPERFLFTACNHDKVRKRACKTELRARGCGVNAKKHKNVRLHSFTASWDGAGRGLDRGGAEPLGILCKRSTARYEREVVLHANIATAGDDMRPPAVALTQLSCVHGMALPQAPRLRDTLKKEGAPRGPHCCRDRLIVSLVTYLFCVSLGVICAEGSSESPGVVACSTAGQFVAALANPAVSVALLTNSISLVEWDFAPYALPIRRSAGNFTVLGAYEPRALWPRLDMAYLQNKVGSPGGVTYGCTKERKVCTLFATDGNEQSCYTLTTRSTARHCCSPRPIGCPPPAPSPACCRPAMGPPPAMPPPRLMGPSRCSIRCGSAPACGG